MREAFEKVKAIIDGWDPVDLLTCCHCPSDEYDDISIELAQMLTFDTDVETLKNDIYIIYLSGISVLGHLTKVRRSAKRLREKLSEIRHQRQPMQKAQRSSPKRSVPYWKRRTRTRNGL